VPSNRAQATTMLFAAAPFLRAPWVPTVQEPDRAYGDDLVRQLRLEGRRAGIGILECAPEVVGPWDPLLVVGYGDFAARVIEARRTPGVTILSDGCDAPAVSAAVEAEAADGSAYLLVSPATTFETLGRSSFHALARAGASVLREPADLRSRSRSFVSLVRDELERDETFVFEGAENVGVPYRVRSITSARHALRATA
jgi:hypothetical protein